MLNLFKILILVLQYIVFIIYYIFEEFVINIAKKSLSFIQRFRIYESFIEYINRSSDAMLLFSFFVIALLAEASAIFAGYLTVHGFVALGIGFYILKIVIFIPTVDIFKHNKKRLLKYSAIRTAYYWYILIIRTETYKNIKKSFKRLKLYIKKSFSPIKKIISNMLKKFFHND